MANKGENVIFLWIKQQVSPQGGPHGWSLPTVMCREDVGTLGTG